MSYGAKHEVGTHRLKGDFVSVLTKLYLFYNLIVIILGGILLFVLEFPVIKGIVGFFMGVLVLYLVLQYLTLLPDVVVATIMLLQFKILKPALFLFVTLSVIASFFILFAI